MSDESDTESLFRGSEGSGEDVPGPLEPDVEVAISRANARPMHEALRVLDAVEMPMVFNRQAVGEKRPFTLARTFPQGSQDVTGGNFTHRPCSGRARTNIVPPPHQIPSSPTAQSRSGSEAQLAGTFRTVRKMTMGDTSRGRRRQERDQALVTT